MIEINKGILCFEVGGDMAFVAPMGAPYPWRDLEGPCATSWMWPKNASAASVKTHCSHALVTLVGGKSDAIDRRLALLQIAAIGAEEPNVIAVYWPEARLVHYPTVFVQMAERFTTRQRLPLYLMVDFRIRGNGDGTSTMFTQGLTGLGLMEVEIPRIAMQPAKLREWAMNIAYYLLDRGSPIPDHDTIGVSADHHIRVRHVPSQFGLSGVVMRLGD